MLDKYRVGDYICVECGNKYGKPKFSVATWYQGHCDYCNKDIVVTESRDYCYPRKPNDI